MDFRALKKNGDTFVMSPPNIDWTHEREWRVQGDINLRKVPRLYVIVWSAQEAKEIANSAYAVASLVRGVFPMEHLGMML